MEGFGVLSENDKEAMRSVERVIEAMQDLRRVLGAVPLVIRSDPHLGERAEGKAVPFRSDLMLED